MKRIILHSSPRNEADIIESFCRYHASFCDLILLTLQQHDDNTQDIIRLLQSEGLNIISYDATKYKTDFYAYNNHWLNLAFQEYDADIAFHLDPDEFIFHINGLNPREFLEKIEEYTCYQVPWKTFIYQKDPDDNTIFLPSFFKKHRLNEGRQYYKVIITKNLYENFNIKFMDSSYHEVILYKNIISDTSLPVVNLQNLFLAHFPIRSRIQTIMKILTGRIAMLRDGDTGAGFQWNQPYNEIKNKGDLSRLKLQEISVKYGVPESLQSTITIGEGTMPVNFLLSPICLKYTTYSTNKNYHALILRAVLNQVESCIDLMHKRHKNEYIKLVKDFKKSIAMHRR